jgi:hypothetical protein
MRTNIGTADRILRFITGTIFTLIGVYFSSGFLVLAGLFTLFEALSSWCVLYQIIGKNTCPLPYKKNSFPYLRVLVLGWFILFVAIILNFIAESVQFKTWYDLLNSPNLKLNFDNLIFLFFFYPIAIGVTAYFFLKSK